MTATYLQSVSSHSAGGFRSARMELALHGLAAGGHGQAPQYGPIRPGPEHFAELEAVRERARAAYRTDVNRLLDNSRFRLALQAVEATGAGRSEEYRRGLHDLTHEGGGGHGPVDLVAAARRLWLAGPEGDYRAALADVQSAALSRERPTTLDQHDRAQLDARAEEIRKASGGIDVTDVLNEFSGLVGQATPAPWRTILSDPARRARLVVDLRPAVATPGTPGPGGPGETPNTTVSRRRAAIRFLHEAGSWQTIKRGVYESDPEVARLLFDIRGELSAEIQKEFDAGLIGTVKSMMNDADYNFALKFGTDGINSPIDNMQRAMARMQAIVDDALGTAGKGNWELIWESNFYLDPQILHLHTRLTDPGDRVTAWRTLTRDSFGLFMQILSDMHTPEPVMERYRSLLSDAGRRPSRCPTPGPWPARLGLREWSGPEGRSQILECTR